MGVLDPPVIPQESLGTKLRRLAVEASKANPWTRPYMKALLPWQPSTAYLTRDVRVNGGYIYVCVGSGTSASTGGPTLTSSTSATDGTVLWNWFGYNQVTSDPSSVPSAWVASTAVTLGQQRVNGSGVYAVVVAGTTAASGGPTGTGNAITDGSATWTYMGPVYSNPYAADFPAYSYSTTLPSGMNNLFNFATMPNAAVGGVPSAGGSGYTVNDTITLTGGTFTTAAVLRVTAVSAGAVTAVALVTAGAYTVLPATPTAQGSTSGSGTGATFNVRFGQPAACKFRGCAPVGASLSIYCEVRTFQATPNSASIGQHTSYEFWTDSPKFHFRLGSGDSTNIVVIIDGVRYNLAPLDATASANNYYTFDFTGSSGRKRRFVRIETTFNSRLSQIAVDSTSQVWAPGDASRVRALCISDSLWAGSSYGPFLAGNTVSLRLGHELGWDDVWSFTQGGTGYTARGTNAGVTTDKYSVRIAEALTLSPDIWILMGSTNDIGVGGTQAAVTAALSAIRAGSTAPIVVLGLWPLNNSGLAATETAVAAGVAGADPLGKTWFIPIYADPVLPWVTGSWNNNPAPSGISNVQSASAALYIAGDNAHPPDVGTEYLARRIASAIRSQVLPYIK